MWEHFVLRLAVYLLPMYITNASAVLFAGRRRLDGNITMPDGRPLLGLGKTLRGTVLSFLAGILAAFVLSITVPQMTGLLTGNYFPLAVLLCLGTILGDLTASFFKRRLGLESGHEVLLLDQLDFVAGALVLGWIYYAPSLLEIAAMIALTLVLHRLSNWAAFKFKLKKVPW